MAKEKFGGQVYGYGRRYQYSNEDNGKLPYDLRITLTQLHAAGAIHPDRGKTVDEILISLRGRLPGTTVTTEDIEENLQRLRSLQGTQGHEKKVYVDFKIERGMRYWLGKDGREIVAPSSNLDSRYFEPKRESIGRMCKDGKVPRSLGEL